MTAREASCVCGQLLVRVEGEPLMVSICCCFACQRRTGSVASVQGSFNTKQVAVKGEERTYVRHTGAGEERTYHFCPTCGSTVFWEAPVEPGVTYVPVGAFADPTFPAPTVSVWESRRHPWFHIPDGITSDA
jgi:hypothetical protein